MRAVRVLLGLHVAYLLAGNFALSAGIGESLANRRPEKFRMTWGAAYTLYPGHVHASDVRIAGHARRIVWHVQADAMSGRLALLPLLRKEVRLPLVRAEGISAGASRIDVERAPAPGKAGGWTLRLDRVEATHVRQANYGHFVVRGDGVASFGLIKQMRGGPMEVLPSQARFAQATGWLDGQPLLDEMTLAVTGAVDRHRRDEAPGIQKLLKTTATVEVDARTVGLHVEAAREKAARLQRLRRPGELHVKLAWNRGSFEPGSGLALSIPVESEFIEAGRELEATATMQVGPRDIRGRLQIAPGTLGALHADADFTIAGRDIPLSNPGTLLARTDGHLRASWRFDSLAWIGALIPGTTLVSFDGAGRVESDLAIVQGKLQPGSRVTVPGVEVSAVALGNVFRGTARADIVLESAGTEGLRSRLDATMARFSVAPVDAREAFYVTGQNLRLEVVSQGELAGLKDKFHARMVFADAVVPDLRVYNRYLPRGLVTLQGGSGNLSGDLRFDGEGEVASGTLAVTGRSAVVAIGDARLDGNFRLDAALRRAELQAQGFVADGTRLQVDSLKIREPDRITSEDWWGNVVLQSASLSWGRPMRIDGRASVQVRDLEPLLAVFAEKKHLPAWIRKLVDEGEARVDGHVSWQDRSLLLDDVTARNDRFEVLAQLQSQDKVRRGDLYARWGKLSVGVELDGAKHRVHLVDARNWYDARPPLRQP